MVIKYHLQAGINQKMQGLSPSATLAINEKSQQLVNDGKKVYRLGFGQSPFPVPTPVVEALVKHAHEKDYLPVKGLYALRETIAAYWKRIMDLDYTAEDIMISPGSKNLLFLIQLVCDAELLLPSPSWVSYAPQAIIAGSRVSWLKTYPENNWMLDAKGLASFCAANPNTKGILVLNYPSNPTGASYSASQLEALATVARKYGLIVVSDEIYGELHHEGQHISIAKYFPEGTIISNGLSKWAGAGGWRLGMFTFPKKLRWLMDSMAVAASETYTTTSAPIQYAAITAYKPHPSIEKQLHLSRRILKTIGRYIHMRLEEMQVAAPFPEGGFYLFPDFSFYKDRLNAKGIYSSPELCDHLLMETGIALLPSFDFGRPSSELTTRLSYVDFDGANALKVAERDYSNKNLDDQFIMTCCQNMTEAMDKLKQWLTSDGA